MALYELMQDPKYRVERLITSVNTHYNRVSMHGLRISLLEAQAKAIGVPLQLIKLPENPNMETYNRIMSNLVQELKNEKFTHCAFGDIFLEDLRKYREEQLLTHGIKVAFPLWEKDTTQLIHDFIQSGFKAIIVCCDANLLGENFAGRLIDEQFLKDLPKNVDPCGENGEFHTFCFDGPIFRYPVNFTVGEKIYRKYKHPNTEEEQMGFWFCDLMG